MKDIDRIVALERELEETREAAFRMLMSMADAVVTTPEGREELAQGFEEAAAGASGPTASLATMVVMALRRGEMVEGA